MRSRSYYSFSDMTLNGFNRCSVELRDVPLVVNCAGQFCSEYPFRTDNREGRLDYYIMYITSGELYVSLSGGEQRAGAGSVLVFPPNYRYQYSFLGGEISYYWCHFTGSDAETMLRELGFSELPLCIRLAVDMGLSEHFEEILSGFSESRALRRRSSALELERLFLVLARYLERGEKKPLSRSISYIHESYTREISIPELAKMENLSVSRYNAVFRQLMGSSPVKYISDLRMQNACEFLALTDLSIKQIGSSVGYPDPHFFSKQFKRYIGSSPKEYRQRLKK